MKKSLNLNFESEKVLLRQHKQLRPVTNVQQSQQKSDSAVAVSKASALNPDGPYSEKGTKCPRKINMDLDDLALFNTDDPNAGEKCLEGLRRQLNDCRRKVQANKQLLELNRNRLKNLETEDLSVDVEKIAEVRSEIRIKGKSGSKVLKIPFKRKEKSDLRVKVKIKF